MPNLFLLLLLTGTPVDVQGLETEVVSVTNNIAPAVAAADLHVTFAGTGGSIVVPPATVIAPGCTTPTVASNTAVTNTAEIVWAPPACVPSGGTVTFPATTANGPMAFAGGFWTNAAGENIGNLAAGDITVANAGAGPLGPVPVTAKVVPIGGGAAVPQVIGNITVTLNVAGTQRIVADFVFDPRWRFLDEWYDFRWINVLTGYTINGVLQAAHPNLGTLPGIDPSPVDNPAPGDGPAPYYYNAPEWAAGLFPAAGGSVIRTEGVRSTFRDTKGAGHPAGTVLYFSTFLVADDITAGGIAEKRFCVLDGFSWIWQSSTNQTAIVARTPPNPGLINAALQNGAAPFPTWAAFTGCRLTGCEKFTRCARWPRYEKAYTIESYKYTNFWRGYEWEVIDENHPIEIPAGEGPPVVRYFDVPFSPNDLHMIYSWPNAFIRTHHWKWNFTKGGSFFWRWYCLKFPLLDVFVCSGPETEPSLCVQEVDCIEEEECEEPYELGLGDDILGDLEGNGGSDVPVVCGNNVAEPGETCDGTDDDRCRGQCQPDCSCPLPAVTEWGLIALTLLLLTGIAIKFGRWRRPTAP